MKTKSFIAGMLLIATMPVRAATNDLSSTLQKGLFEEEANLNLDAAAQAYQAVSAQFDKDRKLAATAIFRLGEVYRKQGRTNEATAQYERIVREFADQSTLVTLSRQNLAGTGAKPESPFSPALTQTARLEQKRLLEEEIKLVEQDLADLRKQLANGVVPQSEVRAKERDVLRLRQQVAALDVDDTQASATKDAGAVVTDDEEKEIRRIQDMIRNSPDLINAKGAVGETPLANAAARGQLRVVQFLLDHGANIQGQSSALNLAALNGHKAVVELLLGRGADVNARDSSGKTPLHTAAENGFQSVAETLLAHKADVNAQTKQQETPLILAAAKGHSAMVDLLIAKGAQLDAKDAKGWTALATAAIQGHALIVKRLLVARVDPNIPDSSGRTALSYAVQHGIADVVKALLEGKVDPNAGSVDSPLLLAVRAENAALTELLLRAGADPNQATDCAQLYMDRQSGRTTRRSNANRVKRSPLQAAVVEEYPAMVKLLLQFKGDAKAKDEGGSPLVLHALNNLGILKAMLEAGADANARPEKGPPALLAAAGYGNSAAVELLVKHGADVNVRDDQGRTPLHIAAENNDKKSVALLLDAKADVNAAATSGLLTALHRAVYIGSGQIVEILLAHGANPNLKDNTGNTPLHWALGIGGKGIGAQKMVELLLSKGADPNLRNNDGHTALDLVKGANSPPAPGFVGFASPPPLGIPGIPTRTLRQPAGSASSAKAEPVDLAALLRVHGAQDWVPQPGQITVTRRSTGVARPAFEQGTNSANRFTLLEVIAVLPWGKTSGSGAGVGVNPAVVPFPDFSRVTISRRDTKTGKLEEIPVDVAALVASGDCSKDFLLDWGDLMNIPDREHTLNEQWQGLSPDFGKVLAKCLQRKVTVEVKGEPQSIILGPLVLDEFGQQALVHGNRVSSIVLPFRLTDVLRGSARLFSTSDLTRVKVRRVDPATDQTQEWVFNEQTIDRVHDLWVRDGDVIEVPDKP